MTLAEKINEEIKEAMRQKNLLRLEVLRMLKSKILAVDARGQLCDDEVVKLFKTYQGNLQEALEQTKSAARPEMEEKLQKELAIVAEFLPQAISLDKTREIILQAIEEVQATSRKATGPVMKAALKREPKIDGKVAKALIDELLEP